MLYKRKRTGHAGNQKLEMGIGKNNRVIMKCILFLSVILISFKGYEERNVNDSDHRKVFRESFFQYDTSAVKLKSFKAFSKNFFKAVENNDTNFVKEHVIFPLVNSSFYSMDTTVPENKRINQKYFLARLHSLFPKDVIKRLAKEGEFSVSKDQKSYVIKLYNHEEMESNYSWLFIKKQNKFYFTKFMTETY